MLEVRSISNKPPTLFEWYRDRAMIDLDPSYQRRGNLWPEKNKQLLINSVLNKYDVPKIYVADFTYSDTPLKENKKPYAIIDGKQRFMIFFEFFSDRLKLDTTPVQYEEKTLTLTGLNYSELKNKYYSLAKLFEDYVPAVMSVISDNLEEVQELFIRLNLNVSISGPERRNAMPGPLPILIRRLSVHAFFRENATFPINRGQDLNAAAKFLLMEDRGGFVNTKKQDLDRFVRSKTQVDPSDLDAVYVNAASNLDKMAKVFSKKDPLLKTQAQITVYYWLIRKYTNEDPSQVHKFLIDFESQRSLVRRQQAARARNENVQIRDPALVDYNSFIRTPDDKSKQESMFSQIEKRLKEFIRHKM